MGKGISKMTKAKKEIRILMAGLDGAGKTSLLYKFSLGNPIQTVPTIGFNSEEVKYKNLMFAVWDVGGQDKIRGLWRHYYAGTEALIFVVDSSDSSRFDEARHELYKILAEKSMKRIAVLIFGNKSDLTEAASKEMITEAMDLNSIPAAHKWHLEMTCGITEKIFDDAIDAGFDWLAEQLRPAKAISNTKSKRPTDSTNQDHQAE